MTYHQFASDEYFHLVSDIKFTCIIAAIFVGIAATVICRRIIIPSKSDDDNSNKNWPATRRVGFLSIIFVMVFSVSTSIAVWALEPTATSVYGVSNNHICTESARMDWDKVFKSNAKSIEFINNTDSLLVVWVPLSGKIIAEIPPKQGKNIAGPYKDYYYVPNAEEVPDLIAEDVKFIGTKSTRDEILATSSWSLFL